VLRGASCRLGTVCRVTGVRETSARAFQVLGLLLLGAVTVGLCFLALTRETAADSDLVRDEPTIAPLETPTGSVEPSSSTEPSSVEQVKLPKVPDQRLADFTKGDDLPDGSSTFDSPSNALGLRVTTKGLTHGAVTAGESDGLSLVETQLESNVRSLGFRVRFPEGNSGSVVLAARESSAVAALEDGAEALPTGLRFVAAPGSWSLSVVSEGRDEVLSEGNYDDSKGALEFRVVRKGDVLFVVDPSGAVTTATEPTADELIGPFASWGLSESGPGLAPATIESVWAG
jgi:hypothetical protein